VVGVGRVAGMKQLLLMIAVVGCGEKKPLIRNHIEEAIREELKKPVGELTKADYEKVTELYLGGLFCRLFS